MRLTPPDKGLGFTIKMQFTVERQLNRTTMYVLYLKSVPFSGRIVKFLIIMKLSFLLLIIPLIPASASSYAQGITISKKDATLPEVFRELRKQTDYTFIFSNNQIANAKKVSISVKDAHITEVLDQCFGGQPLGYTINNKTITIQEKSSSFLKRIVNLFSAIIVTGIVTDEQGNVLPGATVKLQGLKTMTRTDDKGYFSINSEENKGLLIISYLGYISKEIGFSSDHPGPFKITLEQDESGLNEVEIVSTGYQNIPKERATGSFTTLDNKTLNRGIGINILDRLEGVTSGLLTKPLFTGQNEIAIHGRSTIFSDTSPLIVLNGFPYEGTIEQINPADIENINILKDAAASSIWGARSGNGVIVIITKSGRKNQKLTIGMSSTFSRTAKEDQYYIPQLSSSEFIELEQYLFLRGFFAPRFSNPYNGVSPVVALFNQRQLNLVSIADSAMRIAELKGNDIRSDLDHYINRNKFQQQYQMNISGGVQNHKYYISGGYDRNLEGKKADSYNRATINVSNVFFLFKDRLEISGELNYVSSNNSSNGNTYDPRTPYDKLAGTDGVSLPVVGRNTFRTSYVDTAGNGKLLDWNYRPKDELLATNNQVQLNQYRIRAGLNFKIISGLNLSANYQYLNEGTNANNSADLSSYAARHLINQFSSISGNGVNRIMPLGDILNETTSALRSKIFRTQLNFSKTIGESHEVSAILGYEGSDGRKNAKNQVYYGYDPQTLIHANNTINPLQNYKYYYSSQSGTIPTAPILSGTININQSIYSNASYTYKRKYTISGSARRDESNLFGVKTNQKGVPLWSLGLAWNIHNEEFFKVNSISALKARLTYGYNGNFDKSVSALLTAIYPSSLNLLGSQYGIIRNPPNPSLRWEKVKTLNAGLDFTIKGNRIWGSIDAYQKKAVDLIGNNPIAYQSGIEQFRGNGADLKTNGVDLVMNTLNITIPFKWSSALLFNYNVHKVTNYKVKQSSNFNVINNGTNPLEGYPYDAVFSFPSAGLDATGAPQGYIDGAASKDYTRILNQLDPGQLKYHGSGSPKYFGSIINTFSYQNFELSFNLVYKLGYYFRRANVFSGSNYGTAANMLYRLSDFDERWQKPGDELSTRIPALTYPENALQNSFFSFSEDLVELGDHVRLQDVRISYNLSNPSLTKSAFGDLRVFFYAGNLGILWRANKYGIDPDYGTTIIPRGASASIGINLNL